MGVELLCGIQRNKKGKGKAPSDVLMQAYDKKGNPVELPKSMELKKNRPTSQNLVKNDFTDSENNVTAAVM